MALDPMVQRLESEGLGILVESPQRGPALPRGDDPRAQPHALRFCSDRDSMTALRGVLFQHPELLDGADVALPVVGLAAAYLLIIGKVGRVYTRNMSHQARSALNEEGIEHSAGNYVRKLPERALKGFADLERRARSAVTAQAFLDELKRLRG